MGNGTVARSAVGRHVDPLQRPCNRRPVAAPDYQYESAGHRRIDSCRLVCRRGTLGFSVRNPRRSSSDSRRGSHRTGDRHLLLSWLECRGFHCHRNCRSPTNVAEGDDRRHGLRGIDLRAPECRLSLGTSDQRAGPRTDCSRGGKSGVGSMGT